MNGGTLFSRVIPADKDRGFVLLLSWEKPVVQRTCYSMSSMSAPSRAGLDALIAAAVARTNASKVIDVTAPAIVNRLARMFGEVPERASKEKPAE